MFIGRDDELDDLERLKRKRTASLVTCRGRRRIGKSTLIRQFGKKAKQFIAIEGLPPRPNLSNREQLRAFGQQLAQQTSLPPVPLHDWPTAFQLLASTIRNEPTVILLDEISWMGGHDPDFPGHLKIAWDVMLKQHPKLILVLCGSVSAWIERNILKNTGFVGRDSWDIVLGELPLHHCDRFWGKRYKRISSREKLALLSITGGVPRYLEELDPSLSADENIRHLCFRPQGLLFREFDQIFSDVFNKRAESYRTILETLVRGRKTVSEIAEALGRHRSGHMTEYLDDLVLGGFVSRDVVPNLRTGSDTRKAHFRLRDNYARFYLRYIKPMRTQIEGDMLGDVALEQLSNWDTVGGLQFENLVLNNLPLLERILNLGRTRVIAAAPYFQKKTKRWRGCQVDLILMTKHSIYVVEIKKRRSIGAEVIDEVKEKLERLPIARGVSIRTALVYEGQLNRRVEEEGFFDFIIPFDRMLEP